MAINHGSEVKASWVNQLVSPVKFSAGKRYVLSANMKIDKSVEGSNGKAFILVRFHDDRSLDQLKFFKANGDTSCKKLSLHFTVPPAPLGNTESLCVVLGSINTAERTWFDHVQFINKGDFEDGIAGWNTDNRSSLETDPAQSNSGTNSLKIVGGEEAEYLLRIDGDKYYPAHPGAWFNSLDTFGMPSADFGLRQWQEDRHSIVPGR